MNNHLVTISVVGAALVLLMFSGLSAQDSTATAKPDTVKKGKLQEMVLEEIFIEAVIEKPNVSILPAREKPDFEEIEFVNRSFEQELKAGPEKLILLESELSSVKKIEKLKKILAKNKK
ncbi:MAG: hypothetical protein ACE5HO_09195 [bacterium]